jgi:SP family general alpha glucoside:H+ symporter-like MFS transporter
MEKDQENATAHAALAEHEQSLWQALKAEPKAVFWSVAVSSAV